MGPVGGEPQAPSPRPPEGTAPKETEGEGIIFRDNRRFDPKTFTARERPNPVTPAPAEPPTPDSATNDGTGESADTGDAVKVAELTADLQRITAEYANYRKRVDRDRDLQRELTVGAVLADLLPILDDVSRAREHGELEGGFKAVGESVEGVTTKYGLQTYGVAGEPFDPNVHEAMTSETSADVTEPTVRSVYQVGYRIKDRVIRPARVAVVDGE